MTTRAAMIMLVASVGGMGVAPGRAEPPLPRHVTPATRDAIEKGLKYLERTQGRDGAWRNNGHSGRYPVAMSALAAGALRPKHRPNGPVPAELARPRRAHYTRE